jgi:hypothetical protein
MTEKPAKLEEMTVNELFELWLEITGEIRDRKYNVFQMVVDKYRETQIELLKGNPKNYFRETTE